MASLYIVVAVVLLVSLVFDRKKTLRALKIAGTKFLKILPSILALTVGVAVVLYFVGEDTVARLLGDDRLGLGSLISVLVGAVAFIPGFIVFPLSGVLRDQGVPYMVISSFTTSLMMVGVLTLGIEKEYLGLRLAVARNIAGLVMALLVALVTGLVFGEIGI